MPWLTFFSSSRWLDKTIVALWPFHQREELMSVRPLTLALWLALLAGCGSSGGGEQQPPITPSTPASDALDLSPVAVTAPESGLAEGYPTQPRW